MEPESTPSGLDAMYRAPTSALADSGGAGAGDDLLVVWEHLRLHYNIILAVATLLAIPLWGIDWRAPGLVMHVFMRGLAANLCYCAGPVLNAWAQWFGLRHRAVTIGLFLVGTVFSILLVLVSLAFFALRGFESD